MVDLDAHEQVCNLPKCENFSLCGNIVKVYNDCFGTSVLIIYDIKNPKESKTCDSNCLLLSKVGEADGDWGKVYKEIKAFLKNYGPSDGISKGIN